MPPITELPPGARRRRGGIGLPFRSRRGSIIETMSDMRPTWGPVSGEGANRVRPVLPRREHQRRLAVGGDRRRVEGTRRARRAGRSPRRSPTAPPPSAAWRRSTWRTLTSACGGEQPVEHRRRCRSRPRTRGASGRPPGSAPSRRRRRQEAGRRPRGRRGTPPNGAPSCRRPGWRGERLPPRAAAERERRRPPSPRRRAENRKRPLSRAAPAATLPRAARGARTMRVATPRTVTPARPDAAQRGAAERNATPRALPPRRRPLHALRSVRPSSVPNRPAGARTGGAMPRSAASRRAGLEIQLAPCCPRPRRCRRPGGAFTVSRALAIGVPSGAEQVVVAPELSVGPAGQEQRHAQVIVHAAVAHRAAVEHQGVVGAGCRRRPASRAAARGSARPAPRERRSGARTPPADRGGCRGARANGTASRCPPR